MAEEHATREVTITRIFDAPRELVFAMWTQAEHLAKWWGPEGFTVPSIDSDPRPGGVLSIVMRGPDGVDYPQTGTFEEVAPHERLVFREVALGPEGQPILDALTTVLFADRDGTTEVTMHARGIALTADAVPMLGGMQAGWNQSLQCLDDVLTGAVDRQIVLMRMFEAPRERVFEAWTTREHVEKWFGPAGFSLTIDEMDVRPGGTWRFTMHGPDGVDYQDLIVYEEITPAERLVYTHSSLDTDDPPFRTTVTFDDFMGMTVLTMRGVFDTAEARDLVIEKHGAVEGGNQTLDRLGELLGAMAPAEDAHDLA